MSEHLELELLAQLAEGRLPADETARAREHLAGCRTCTVAYADAVRYRAAWLAANELFDSSGEPLREVRAAEALAFAPPSRGGRPPRWIIGALAASVAVAFGALALVRATRAPTLRFELPPAVRSATEWSSARGLVLPGGERMAGHVPPALRSGIMEASPDLEHELDSLTAGYERERSSRQLNAAVVAALLAANDAPAAGDYAREGLRVDSSDVRLLVLAAAASDRIEDVAGAEQLLRAARRRAPGDPLVRLDLALVLRRRGQTAEARSLLERVANGSHAELAARARQELEVR